MVRSRTLSRRLRRRRLRHHLPGTRSPQYRRLLLAVPIVLGLLHVMKQSSLAIPWQSTLMQPAFLSPAWVPQLAQAAIPIPLARQGQQVVINGRAVSMPWSQRQQALGVADVGLMQKLGVELLTNEDAATQPISWFSDPAANPIALSTWFTEQYRYLDLSQLAQQHGWQIGVNNNHLEITTPASRVTAVRQGRQSWGDRIVIDLDRSTPWAVSQSGSEVAITIDAAIDPALKRSFAGQTGNRLSNLRIEGTGNRTVLRFSSAASLPPRVWSLPNPARLIVDVRPDFLPSTNVLWSNGIRWQQQTVNLGNSFFPVVSIEVDPRQPGVSLKPILSNPTDAAGTAPLPATASRDQVAAAINGGFFNRNNQLPLGAIRTSGQWKSGPILNRGAIGWDEQGMVAIGRLTLQETVATAAGQRFPVLSLNSGFVGAGVSRYTPDWGANYTAILDNEVGIAVQNNRVVRQQPLATAGSSKAAIPADGYLLVVRANRAAAAALPSGTEVTLETTTQPPEFSALPQIMGGGPLLLNDRQVVLNPTSEQFSAAFSQQAASRSVVGVTANGHLLLTTIHSRAGGYGPTLPEAAQIMQQIGAVDALNLDGGSSTSLYLGGQLLDRPAETAARVHNGIGVFLQPRL